MDTPVQTPRPASAREYSQRGAQTRKALIKAATRLFGERGFAGTTTRAIATEAGCNLGLISFYFDGKEGLYAEVRANLAEELRAIIDPITARLLDLAKTDVPTDALLAEGETLITQVLAKMPHAGDDAHFLLLRRALRESDEASRDLYTGIFMPLYKAIQVLLDRAFPRRKRENALSAFLVIDAIFGILRDYPVLFPATGHAPKLENDAEPFGRLLAKLLRP